MANTNNFPANPTDGQTFVAADGVTFIYDATNSYWNFLSSADTAGIVAYNSANTYSINDIVYNTANGIIYRSITDNNTGNALTNVLHWLSLGGATQFAPESVTSTHFDTIGIPNDTVGANLILSKNNLTDGLSPTPNRSVEIFGTGGINVIAHGERDVIEIDGSGTNGVEHVLDLETVFSFTDGTTAQELVGYVNLDVFDNIRITAISGVTGTWTVADHALVPENHYVVAWDSSFAVGIALTSTTIDILRYHVHSGDSQPDTSGTGQAATVITLENVQPQNKEIGDLADVDTTAEDTDNNVLFYNPDSGQWFASDSFTRLVHSVDTLKEQINLLSHSVTDSVAATRVNDALRSIVAVDNNPADDAEYDYVHNQLLWRVEPQTNSDGTFIQQAQAANAYREAGGIFAVSKNALPNDAALVVDANDVYYFRLTGFQATGQGSNQYNVIAQLIDITGEDQLISDYAFSSGTAGYNSWFFNINNVVFDHMTAVDAGSGIVGITEREATLLGYLDTAAVVANDGDYLTIDELGAIVATDAPTTGIDTALRELPDTVATDSTWTSYITKLGFTGDEIPSGTQFPAVGDHTPGDLFILTAGHTQPADDDLIYVGLYVLVQNTPTNEWVHLTEYKTTEVELNYPGGSENVTFYGNKGVEDLAQDLLDTTALVYNNMNLALGLKQDTIDADNAEDIRTVLNVADGADVTPANGIYLETATAADQAIPKWNATSSQWELGTDTGGGSLTIQEDGTTLTTAATTLNFVGQGVTATGNGATKTITIPGGNDIPQFGSVTQWLNSLTAPTGSTLVVDDQQVVYTPSGGSPVTITFLEFIHPVAGAVDQDVDAILSASGYGNADEFYLVGTDRLYYVATTGNHLHLNVIPIELGDLSDVVITEVADGEVLQWNNSNSRWENAVAGGVSNNFRYALLLTNGFLLPENSAMSTADRDAYTDTLGVYGAANTVYWFDNTNDGWFNVATGGTALISFPS